MFRIVPPLRTPTCLGLLVLSLALPACAGQDLARRDGISFSHSRLATFQEIAPEDPVYTRALADALRAASVRPEDVAALPRVVKGSSYLVDPPYLGRTGYLEGVIFVWDGTEAPLREVLTHEMIHWVLFHAGMPERAQNEVYVARLTSEALGSGDEALAFRLAGLPGETVAERAAWHDIEVGRRNAARKSGGRLDRMESDLGALAFERTRGLVPQHPRAFTP